MISVSQVMVLAEDDIHQQFVRRYLYRTGYSKHTIYFEPLPEGRGCGEQWVRDRYAAKVEQCRQRSTRAQTALVVVIDADTEPVESRLEQLNAALVDHGVAARGPQERISHLVPKRSIETWILCLSGRNVNEQTDCSKENVNKLIAGAATTFFEWSRLNIAPPAHCTPSLHSAIPEIRRLD